MHIYIYVFFFSTIAMKVKVSARLSSPDFVERERHKRAAIGPSALLRNHRLEACGSDLSSGWARLVGLVTWCTQDSLGRLKHMLLPAACSLIRRGGT